MEDHHFNILIKKIKIRKATIIYKFIIARGANEEVATYGNTPFIIPCIFSPSSPSISFS
jgi:hypothetical protein